MTLGLDTIDARLDAIEDGASAATFTCSCTYIHLLLASLPAHHDLECKSVVALKPKVHPGSRPTVIERLDHNPLNRPEASRIPRRASTCLVSVWYLRFAIVLLVQFSDGLTSHSEPTALSLRKQSIWTILPMVHLDRAVSKARG